MRIFTRRPRFGPQSLQSQNKDRSTATDCKSDRLASRVVVAVEAIGGAYAQRPDSCRREPGALVWSLPLLADDGTIAGGPR